MTTKVKYVGDPNDPTDKSENIMFRNVFFERDKAVDVPDDVAEKLKGNNHFKVQGAPDPMADKLAAEKAAAKAAAAKEAADREDAEKKAKEDAAKKGAA